MLAVAGGKGGCGKTTTALGLSRAFDGETVVVDVDTDMPNLHALAGVDREPMAGTGGRPQRVSEGVAVLSAPDPTTSDAAVPTILDRVQRRTDARVVVDCPGGSGPDAAAPLAAATRVVLVSTACAPALRDATKTAAMARALGCRVAGVVLTRTSVAPTGVSDLFDCPLLGVVPNVTGSPLESTQVETAYAEVAAEIERRAGEGGSQTPGAIESEPEYQ